MNDNKTIYDKAIGRLKRVFVFVGLFSALVNVLMLTGPMFMLQVYDRVLSSGSVATLQALFAIVVFLFAFMACYDFLRVRFLSRAAYQLDQAVGQSAYRIWVRQGLAGEKSMSRPISDLAVIRGFVPSPGMLGLFDTPWIPFYLVVVFLVHPWLGYLAMGGLAVVVFAALLNQAFTRKHFARAMSMDGTEAFFVEQSRRNAEAILPLGMEDRIADRWAKMHRSGLGVGQVGADRAEGFTAFSKAFRLLLQSALLALGGYLALQQEISAGMIVAASIIAGRALAPVDQVIGQWRSIVRANEAHRRLEVLYSEQLLPKQVVKLPAPTGHLNLRNVTKFAPMQKTRGDRPPILDQVSFSLEPGDAVGVVGPSASGKSTLARILVGAWKADSGEVRIDGATLDQWSRDDLGEHIGYLPQSLELMSGTIRDNIARFDPKAEDKKVIEAAQIAGVHDMILQLPDGYATELGFGSQPLSGGQQQRLGLARAVYGMPRYVVLDEPNSNLDAPGDEALAKAIMTLREAGSTVVVMAHRPSAIAAVNKVLVLHGGRVSEFGDKREIFEKTAKPTRMKDHSELHQS